MNNTTEQNDGATPKPPENSGECMGRYQHHWHWVWEEVNGVRVWTDRVRCSTCLMEREPEGVRGKT